LGIGAQWLASRLGIPSILCLLVVGLLAGPFVGLIDPDALLGDLLSPLVSLLVAVILFEGGLNLRVSEVRGVRKVVRRLISVGVLLT
jgi:NhaP-type Na+/H+ or K+/H+ antiporter